MGRRGNNEGSIRQRKDGRYEARYTVQTSVGPKQKTIMGRKNETRKDVSARLTRAMADRDGGLIFDAGMLTVGDYLDSWLEDVIRGTVRESTLTRYRYAIVPHLKPALGHIKVAKLTPAHVRVFYRAKLDGEGGAKPLSPASVQKLHVVLYKALKQAVQDGLIPRNICDAVKPPRVERKEVNPLDAGDANRLLDAAKGDRLEALYVLAIHTGMRQGEMLALRWDDVDLEAGLLRVRRTLTKSGKHFVSGEPKTKKSRRTVMLASRPVEALRDHLTRQMEEMDTLGSLYQTGGLVFAAETGTIINPSNLRNRSFARLVKRAGLAGRGLRFHDLRHTAATLLLSRNVNPKVVSEMLGHATIAITLDTYSHVLPHMQEQAVQAMEEALTR